MANWNIDNLLDRYDSEVGIAQELMISKNHDYGSSWENDRAATITDIMRHKLDRIWSLEELRAKGELPKNAEGITAELHDIMNYCIFRLIKEEEFNAKVS